MIMVSSLTQRPISCSEAAAPPFGGEEGFVRILDTAVYLGPNLHAPYPVLRLRLDLAGLEEWPVPRLGPAFAAGLIQTLPTLQSEEDDAFVRSLSADASLHLGHVLERVVLALQNLAGADVRFGRTRSTGQPGVFDVIVAYHDEALGLAAARLGVDLLRSLLPRDVLQGEPLPAVPAFDWREARASFLEAAQRTRPTAGAQAVAAAAAKRGIPVLRLPGEVLQLGYGRHGRRLRETLTGAAAHGPARHLLDKARVHALLAEIGLPVPAQRQVASAEEAMAAAREIGLPVLVKPAQGCDGEGVSAELHTWPGLDAAFAAAAAASTGHVVVEKALRGREHRLLVVGGRCVAAVERLPPRVVGDGRHTLAELVDEANCDPERGVGAEAPLVRLAFDRASREWLAQRGLEASSVPAAGQAVDLWPTGDWRRGGSTRVLTGQAHPDYPALAERAARMLGLEVAAVDVVTTDLRRPRLETGGAIVEVDAQPDLHPFLQPDGGQASPVAELLVAHLVPAGAPSRIPVVAIAGTNGKTVVARMVAHLLRMGGRRVGLACSDGIEIDGARTLGGDRTGPGGARRVLADPDVEVAVLETGRGGLARHGLGFEKAEVGAVLNVHADRAGLDGVETTEQQARLLRTVAEVAGYLAVLNADDPFCLQMADHAGAPFCYFTANPDHSLVREHVRHGGSAIVLEDGVGGKGLVWHRGGQAWPLLELAEIPSTFGGRAACMVQNAMAASAIALGLGLPLDALRLGLATFLLGPRLCPGRLNVYDELPFRVVVDGARNPSALEALLSTLESLTVGGRRLCVLSAPGDRRDTEIQALARLAAGRFDVYFCRRDAELRGRRPDEVPRLLRDELLLAGVADQAIEVVPEGAQAVQLALSLARQGDLLLLLGDAPERSWDQVVHYRPRFADIDADASTLAMPFVHALADAHRPPPSDLPGPRDVGE
jgi:cyanophycin synthetase